MIYIMKEQFHFNRMGKIDFSALKFTGFSPHISLPLLMTIDTIAMATPSVSLDMSVS